MTTPRRALVVVSGAQLAALTLWFSAAAVGPSLQEEWGITTAGVAALTLAVQAGFVIGALALAVGGVSDAVNARHLFVVSALVGAAANLGLVAVGGDRFAVAVVLRGITGFALAGVYPSGLKVMAGWFERGRGAALGLLVGALTVGSAAPHLIRGMGLEWRAVMVTASVLAVVAAGMMSRIGDGPHEATGRPFAWRHTGSVVRNRGVRLATLGYLGHMWELYAMWTWTAAFLTASWDARGFDSTTVPVVTFMVIAVGGVGAWSFGVWADRVGREVAAGAAMMVSGGIAAVTPLVFGAAPWVVVPVFLLWGFVVVADSAQFSALVTEHARPAERGTALTLQVAVGFLLTLVTIRGVPVLAETWGWRWAFAILAVGPAVGTWAMVRLRSATRRGLLDQESGDGR